MSGHVSVFVFENSRSQKPLFVQTYGEGELLNERTCLTPFPTDHGAIVVSDSAEFMSFPATSASVNTEDNYDPVAGHINKNMMLKLAHIDMIKNQLLTYDSARLLDCQAKFVSKWRIDLKELDGKIEDANKLKKLARFDQIRKAPSQNIEGGSKFKIDALATQHFNHNRGLQMNAQSLRSTAYLREIVSKL